MPSGHSYDLDPTKAGSQDLKQNQENVELIATKFLHIVISSVPAVPS
jgi:neurofibromin 1